MANIDNRTQIEKEQEDIAKYLGIDKSEIVTFMSIGNYGFDFLSSSYYSDYELNHIKNNFNSKSDFWYCTKDRDESIFVDTNYINILDKLIVLTSKRDQVDEGLSMLADLGYKVTVDDSRYVSLYKEEKSGKLILNTSINIAPDDSYKKVSVYDSNTGYNKAPKYSENEEFSYAEKEAMKLILKGLEKNNWESFKSKEEGR